MINNIAKIKSAFIREQLANECFIEKLSGYFMGESDVIDIYINSVFPTWKEYEVEVASRTKDKSKKAKEFYIEVDDLGYAVKEITNWFDKVGMDASTLEAQKIKLYEELGELAVAFRKKNIEEIKDAIIDTIVVRIMQSLLQGRSKKKVIAEVINGVMNAKTSKFYTKDLFGKMDTILEFIEKANKTNLTKLALIGGQFFYNREDYIDYFFKVADIISERVDGILLDEFGFAIKKEDRS